ncbi:hypothetical protein WG66_009533 [Moniliophthora roreri]|nr:hypothetical protein WG66_009533 [Moniliophthora roreri]
MRLMARHRSAVTRDNDIKFTNKNIFFHQQFNHVENRGKSPATVKSRVSSPSSPVVDKNYQQVIVQKRGEVEAEW